MKTAVATISALNAIRKSLRPFPVTISRAAGYAGKTFILFLAWLLLANSKVEGQGSPRTGTGHTSAADSTVEDRLVARALSGPQIRQMEHQGKMNEYQLEIARRAPWINLLTLSV